MIKGSLSSFNLGEIFQSLSVNHHTGTMKITEKTGEERYIYFSKGEICLFSSTSHPSLRIGEILVRQGAIDRNTLEQALEEQVGSNEKLGRILMKSHGVSAEQVQAALEEKITDEIYDLFLLKDAEFEFFVDHFPEEIFDSFERNLHISINTTNVLMEGLRLSDEWSVIETKISSFDEIFVRCPEVPLPEELTPHQEAIAELVDGRTPVKELFTQFPGSRFTCCKTLFELLGGGQIRQLTLEECRAEGARCSKAGELENAVGFLSFAVQLAPGRPEPQVLLGRILNDLGRGDEAEVAHLRATQLFHESNDHDKVLEVGAPLVKARPRDDELLQAVFQAAVARNRGALAKSTGDALVKLLVEKAQKPLAAEVLLRVVHLFPKETDRRLRCAELLRSAGETDRALTVLEEGLEHLVGRADVSERIKLLRQILDISPERHDVKLEIDNLLALRQRIAVQKKRRFTIFGAAVIALLLLTVIPIVYEIKARELYSHARRLEEIAQNTGNYAIAKTAYRKLVDQFGYSTKAGEAEDALDNIASLERVERLREEARREREKSLQFDTVRKIQETLSRELAAAQYHEERGDFAQAFEIYKRILEEHPDAPQTEGLLLPVTVTSWPAGTRVEVDGETIGQTPLVLRSRPGDQAVLRLFHSGCEDAQLNVLFGEKPTYSLEMQIRPVAQFKLSGPVPHPLGSDGEDLVFASRDGFLYSISPGAQTVNWRRAVGHYGDLISDPLYLKNEILYGNVIGEVAAISRETGKSRWRRFLDSTVLAAPAVSAGKRWAAVGDLDGRVHIIDFDTGKQVGQFETENEILRAPVFWRDALIVLGEDNSLYMLAPPEGKLLHAESFPDGFAADGLVVEDLILFTTNDDRLHAFDAPRRHLKWSRELADTPATELSLHGDTVLVGLQNGSISATRVRDGEAAWELSVAASRPGNLLVSGGHAYLGSIGGEIVAIDLKKREKRWSYRSDASISEAPLIFGQHLFVPSVNGKFFIMELFEE